MAKKESAPAISFGVAETQGDLLQILALQDPNLRTNLSDAEIQREGFLTLKHDFVLLEKMNDPYPHIVAKDQNELIGYALVMRKAFFEDLPLLANLQQQLKNLNFRGEKLPEARFFVMGQVCVQQEYRGQGVFRGLYQEMKTRMQPYFDFIITEISLANKRSLKAHEKIGFINLKTYQTAQGKWWSIVGWDLQE